MVEAIINVQTDIEESGLHVPVLPSLILKLVFLVRIMDLIILVFLDIFNQVHFVMELLLWIHKRVQLVAMEELLTRVLPDNINLGLLVTEPLPPIHKLAMVAELVQSSNI